MSSLQLQIMQDFFVLVILVFSPCQAKDIHWKMPIAIEHINQYAYFVIRTEHVPSKLAFIKYHCVFYLCLKYLFDHKINLCVDIVCMVCFPCLWLYFICVSFEFTLGLCVLTLSWHYYRAHGELRMVSNQLIMNIKNPEHMLAPICWVASSAFLCVMEHL